MQSVVVIASAPLYSGTLHRAEAIVAPQQGPIVLRRYRGVATSTLMRQADFAYLRTGSAIVAIITNEPLPLAVLAEPIDSAVALTLGSFANSLSGVDTAHPAGGLGANRVRWIGNLCEPALIAVFVVISCHIRPQTGGSSTVRPIGVPHFSWCADR